MTIRTSAGRRAFLVCGLCGALVLREAIAQHERWHRSCAERAERADAAAPANTPTDPAERITKVRVPQWIPPIRRPR